MTTYQKILLFFSTSFFAFGMFLQILGVPVQTVLCQIGDTVKAITSETIKIIETPTHE